MAHRILVATDLSEAADEALRSAREYALSSDVTIAVCYVLGAPNFHLRASEDPAAEAETQTVERAVREALQARIDEWLPSAKVEIFIERGRAYAAIVKRAEAWSADLVVVGRSGRSALPRWHLGSVAELVVRNAHCPVVVARETSKRGVVLVATDLSDPSMPAVAAGAEEARRRGARLVVAHAIDFASVAVTIEEIIISVIEPIASWNIDDELRSRLEGELRQALAKCSASGEPRVLGGVAGPAILRCAEEIEPELLVVGTRGRSGLARIALGSVAERVVRAAACSVLAVRLSA